MGQDSRIGHFTVVCSVTWPLYASEAGITDHSAFTFKCQLVSIRTA